MPQIHVILAATRKDFDAESIARAIALRSDMRLVEERFLGVADAMSAISKLPKTERCALLLYGAVEDTGTLSEQAHKIRKDLVILRITSVGDVRIGATFQQLSLPEIAMELRTLVDRVGLYDWNSTPVIQLRPSVMRITPAPRVESLRFRPLMSVAIVWIHALFRSAVTDLPDSDSNAPWSGLNKAAVLRDLGLRIGNERRPVPAELEHAETALTRMLGSPHAVTDPLGRLFHRLRLTPLELRLVLLILAPELDPVYQRCAGLLLDDVSRRVGTLGLLTDLLGPATEVRTELEVSGNIARWRLLEAGSDRLPAADDSLRLDPTIASWLLGGHAALTLDPRIGRARRADPWTGLSLLDRGEELADGSQLVADLADTGQPQWLLLNACEPSVWRALFELGARQDGLSPLRVEPHRLASGDSAELREAGLRFGRLARLTGWPMLIDTMAGTGLEKEALRTFLDGVGETDAHAAILAAETQHLARLLGPGCRQISRGLLENEALVGAVRLAARGADAYLTEADASVIAAQYPLYIDGFEHAMQLAVTQALNFEVEDPHRNRFVAACKDVAAEGLSGLAERIEPHFSLDDVVLPADRKQQLIEIVNSVKFGPKVLDTWKFREQLPYGRGIAALFHGISGTGKSMAAIAVAQAIGQNILRLDLSRVQSKYIGDTEKAIERVFVDAERSGCAILIDEADALLGKRSDVKDAHDHYANATVAWILQRLERFESVCFLTSNIRSNIDSAFLRRLRFIIEFPRPDAEAREKIWRNCLPAESHGLSDAAFHQLGRRIELTGGHIRQITLRAAFIAAASDSLIRLEHIARASRAEFAKLGMPPVELDIEPPRKVA